MPLGFDEASVYLVVYIPVVAEQNEVQALT